MTLERTTAALPRTPPRLSMLVRFLLALVLVPPAVAQTITKLSVSPSGVHGNQACEEAFGPVCTLEPYDDLADAIARANGTRYGLQAGIFTGSLSTALRAGRELEFGGVTVNEAPTFRADQMPYGGVKDSGNTREGPAWAVRELTEERLVVIQP